MDDDDEDDDEDDEGEGVGEEDGNEEDNEEDKDENANVVGAGDFKGARDYERKIGDEKDGGVHIPEKRDLDD